MKTETRRDFLKTTLALGASTTLGLPALNKLLAAAPPAGGAQPAAAPPSIQNPKSKIQNPNILFIICDDLRPELACYGRPAAITPNLDRLAASGVQFNNAYCQASLSGPSRCTILSGLRPSATGYIHNNIRFRDVLPDAETLPEFFGRRGYSTIGLGKIFHEGDKKQTASCFNTRPAIPDFPRPADTDYKDPANKKLLADSRRRMLDKYGPAASGGIAMGPVCEFYDAPDDEYHDGHITTSAIATMKRCAADGKPFFLGVGYKKPHLSFIAPKKYWDMYEGLNIPLPPNNTPPAGAPALALHDSFEMRTRDGVPKYGPFTPELQRHLMRGYLACVSFVDAQVGRLVAALRETGLADNTIIVFCVDHGWHLGEMGVWGKATNYEVADHVPLLIVDPRNPRKGPTNTIVENLDIYPTLADLAGFPIPPAMQGKSLRPILENPARAADTVAISQFPCPALREWAGVKTSPGARKEYFDHALNDIEARIRDENPGTPLAVFQENVIGYTIRDTRHRCVAWVDQSKPAWKIIATELYDQVRDPAETTNIAATAKPTLARLTAQLWKTLALENKFH